jgi:phage FluMu protein Com
LSGCVNLKTRSIELFKKEEIMAVMQMIRCQVCGKNVEVMVSSGEIRTKCNACLEVETREKEEEFLKNLRKKYTIEQRLERVELALFYLEKKFKKRINLFNDKF